MKLKDILKETVAEISYKNSGLKKPNLADLDKNKQISSYEKKRGGAIEKSMKTEFKTQAPKKEGIRFGNEERPMETMPSLSRSEMSAMNPMNNICEKCGASMMYEDKMCAECGYMEEDGDATSLEAALIGGPVKNDQDGYSEGMDHEVFMAKASLQNIVSNASQLMNKMGDEEIDIPAWVQDHITNADNYISQANDGYHEYETGEGNETPDQPVYEAVKEYPTFGDPLKGFPTEYKELLKKLQRSNNSKERQDLKNKMNVIRKKLNLIPLSK